MSILIPGIDMPDSCDNCFVCNRCEGNCDISDADYLPDKRPDDCPLIELPPHGRLGDLDALERNLRGMAGYQHGDRQQGILGCCSTICSAHTIIPADPEKEDT